MTARSTWKKYESRVAADLGGKRIPVTGIDRDGADVINAHVSHLGEAPEALPSWLWQWLAGIVGTASDAGKVGVLILRKPRQEDAEALVVLRYSDWCDLHGKDRT